MRMMQCNAEHTIHVTGTGYKEELWPGKVVDLDRVIRPAVDEAPVKGAPGDDDYQPAVTAQPALTIAEAVRGFESSFGPVKADASAPPASHALPDHGPDSEERE